MKATIRPLILGGLLCAASAAVADGPDAHPGARRPTTAEPPSAQAQKTCPVMVGNPIDPHVFTTYRGKRVYFCCAECKRAFEAAPEKYLGRLPQFAAPAHGDGHSHAAAWGRWVRPMGIATLALVLATAAAGLFRRRKPRLLLRWHKRLAAAAVAVGLCHAALVLFFH